MVLNVLRNQEQEKADKETDLSLLPTFDFIPLLYVNCLDLILSR